MYADSARLALEEQSRAAPTDAERHVLLGLALAYLGQKAEAIRDGQAGVAMLPISQDGYFGPYNQLQLVRIYLLLDEPEKALDQLEPLLRVPFYLSPGWLRIDPTFDPLRNNRAIPEAGGRASMTSTRALRGSVPYSTLRGQWRTSSSCHHSFPSSRCSPLRLPPSGLPTGGSRHG